MYPPILTNISNVENALQKYNIIVAIGNSPNTTTGIPIFDKIIQNTQIDLIVRLSRDLKSKI